MEYARVLELLHGGVAVSGIEEAAAQEGVRWSYWGRHTAEVAILEAALARQGQLLGRPLPLSVIAPTPEEAERECLRALREGMLRYTTTGIN